MWSHHGLFYWSFILDWLGQLLFFAFVGLSPGWIGFSVDQFLQLEGQWLWFVFCLLLYPLLGWLFGSYTVLSWRRLLFSVLLQRLLITSAVTFMVVAIACWLLNPSDDVWFVDRGVQFFWLCASTIWSLLVRTALRRGLFLPDAPRLILLASDDEIPSILQAWARLAPRQRLVPINPSALDKLLDKPELPLLVALSPSRRRDRNLSALIDRLEVQDPRVVQTISVISLFEQQQERLPPALLSDPGLSYDELPWAAPVSVQSQLKRLADLFVAAVLLLIMSPIVALAAFLINLKSWLFL